MSIHSGVYNSNTLHSNVTTLGKTVIMYHARSEKPPKTTHYWWLKKVETYSLSKAVTQDLGEDTLRPSLPRRKIEVTSKTD